MDQLAYALELIKQSSRKVESFTRSISLYPSTHALKTKAPCKAKSVNGSTSYEVRVHGSFMKANASTHMLKFKTPCMAKSVNGSISYEVSAYFLQ